MYSKSKLTVTQIFFSALLQVTISLSKVELSVGESKFFTCTGMYSDNVSCAFSVYKVHWINLNS